jgi:hypothetical protein
VTGAARRPGGDATLPAARGLRSFAQECAVLQVLRYPRPAVPSGQMIYCVVPRPLADTLYTQLVEHYKDDEGVTVIVDRRHFDRRGRAGTQGSGGKFTQRRVIRDRRRARVAGDMLPLAHG